MIVDSSAIIAIIRREPGFERILGKLTEAPGAAVGAPTLAECGIVLEARLGIEARGLLDRVLVDFEINTIHFNEEHWREAVAAFRRYGKGRHPANLNFGDCLTYAVARLAGEPLLFVGDDFARTDIDAA